MMNIIDRFNQYVTYEPNTGCHLWIGNYRKTGYGGFTYYNNKSMTSSRAAYLIFKGEIPDKMQVCHTCDVRECVNPDHLFLGTISQNIKDKFNKGRCAKGKSNFMSKLNESNVVMIKHLIKEGYSNSYIGKLFNVTDQNIYYIRHNKTWKHI